MTTPPLHRAPALAMLMLMTVYTERAQHGPTIDADSLPTLFVKEDLRIGSVDDPKVGFSAILTADIDRDGQFFVYDSQEREIRVLSREGRPLRTIGHAGNGPGEFTRVTAMGVFGDSVWTVDESTFQLNVFRRNGTLASSIRVTPISIPVHNSSLGFVVPHTLGGDGRFISRVAQIAPLRQANHVRATDTVMAPRLRYGPTPTTVDTIGWEPIPPPDGPSTPERRGVTRVQVNGVNYDVPQPPLDTYIRLTMIDGSALIARRRSLSSRPSEFELLRFGLDGRLLHRLRFRYRPGRYEGAILDTIAQRPVRRSAQSGASAFRAVRGALAYPEFQSPVYTAWPANDGSLWLRREDNAGPRMRWIVVTRDGTVRGIVELPRSARPVWGRGDTLVTVDSDDLGVPWLVRYQLRKTR